MNDLWNSLFLSLEIALTATLMTCLIGVPLAYGMARARFPGRSLLEALIMVPLVLPPTVVGYLILLVFEARGWPGSWLMSHFEYSIAFRFEGAVLAAMIVAMPMLYMPAKAAFQEVDQELEDIARVMGANRLQLFWHVGLPLARRGIASGLLLAFARGLGEFGATAMVYGAGNGRLTLPIAIYFDWENGDMSRAIPAVVTLAMISLLVILAYNRWTRGPVK